MTAKERKTLQDMYRSLERQPGAIRAGECKEVEKWCHTTIEREAAARGAEHARLVVYAWLRGENMIPHGGR